MSTFLTTRIANLAVENYLLEQQKDRLQKQLAEAKESIGNLAKGWTEETAKLAEVTAERDAYSAREMACVSAEFDPMVSQNLDLQRQLDRAIQRLTELSKPSPGFRAMREAIAFALDPDEPSYEDSQSRLTHALALAESEHPEQEAE